VELSGDLAAEELERLLPGRPIRSYPALLSTEADALAWARAGAPEGAVVVADYQASPRGRAGVEWHLRPGESVAFSLVLRPRLPAEREGWLYTVAAAGLADALGADTTIEWPDEVRRGDDRVGAIGVQTGLGPEGTEWAVVNVLVARAAPTRAAALAAAVEAIEARYGERPVAVLADYLRRCSTIGRRVRARLIPLGPGGVAITGKAVNARTDGSLVLERDDSTRIAVRPQSLGLLEEADA
jgi:BirA family biotin operon repressor/biotin-[acetyl-CoA-carboxylase] ligase